MQGAVVTSIVLVCSVLMSLATGVLLAYGVCLGMFAMFRNHARSVSREQQVVSHIIRPAA